jgi:DnaJ-domain-containing protein 1
MSIGDWSIILGCLVGGYLFVSRILAGRNEESDSAQRPAEESYTESRKADESDVTPLSARVCYDILDVKAGARPEEIRMAYKRKIAQYHPDKVGGLGDKIRQAAESESKRINQAYDYLQQHGYA